MTRVLPAAIFDAFQASVERVGGVGRSRLVDDTMNPCCIYGHAYSLDHSMLVEPGGRLTFSYAPTPTHQNALKAAGIGVVENDAVVGRLLKDRKDADGEPLKRVPWTEYVEAMQIERASASWAA